MIDSSVLRESWRLTAPTTLVAPTRETALETTAHDRGQAYTPYLIRQQTANARLRQLVDVSGMTGLQHRPRERYRSAVSGRILYPGRSD
jgi:hypothetical protein